MRRRHTKIQSQYELSASGNPCWDNHRVTVGAIGSNNNKMDDGVIRL